MVILSILAVGIGRQANLEINLTKHLIGKVRANSIAWSGLIYAMEQIYLDSGDSKSKDTDTLLYCGIRNDPERSAKSLFHERSLSDGVFTVGHELKNEQGQRQAIFGLADEESKININGIRKNNVGILRTLIELLGFSEDVAIQISFSIIDWIDQDAVKADVAYGAEDDYYLNLDNAYRTKNTFADSLEELLLVKGMTKDVFQKLKEYITVFPKTNILRINFDTASKEVLQALAGSLTSSTPSIEPKDALSLVEKMLIYRMGEDSVSFTNDDKIIDMNAMILNDKEKVIFLLMRRYRTKRSDYLRAQITGIEDGQDTKTTIYAIIQRQDLSIVYWNRN